MKTFKTTAIIYLLIFNLAIILSTALIYKNVNENNPLFALKFLDYMGVFILASILGLIFLLIILFFNFRLERSIEKLKLKHEQEINQFKARLYDKKESESTTSAPVKREPSSEKLDSPKSEVKEEDSTKPDDESTQS
jgi:uncharacterized membrane protein